LVDRTRSKQAVFLRILLGHDFFIGKARLWLAERAKSRGSHGGAPETGFLKARYAQHTFAVGPLFRFLGEKNHCFVWSLLLQSSTFFGPQSSCTPACSSLTERDTTATRHLVPGFSEGTPTLLTHAHPESPRVLDILVIPKRHGTGV